MGIFTILFIKFNDQRAVDDKEELNALLDKLEEEIKTGSRRKENEKLYDKYFDIKEIPVRGIVITPKQEAIDKAEKNYGYFALISNAVKDPIEALEIYRAKDIIEKAFDVTFICKDIDRTDSLTFNTFES